MGYLRNMKIKTYKNLTFFRFTDKTPQCSKDCAVETTNLLYENLGLVSTSVRHL